MVCSLTRTAAEEVAGRDLPIPKERIGTLHSQANRALVGGYTGIADLPKYISEWNSEFPEMALSSSDRDIDEDNASPFDGKAPGDEAYNAMNVYRAKMVGSESWPMSVRAFALRWSDWKDSNGLIDFTDMLEMALQNQELAPGTPDVIFADESQDFSRLEMSLLLKWGQAAGQLVIVGDPYQSLYQWRGADPNVFFLGEAPEENQRVLRQSYRVPKAVHQAAASLIERMPGYRPVEYDPKLQCPNCNHEPVRFQNPCERCGQIVSQRIYVEGLCVHSDASLKNLEDILAVVESSIGLGQSVMILASCAYMLTGVIGELRREGIPFHNEYRRRNGAWNPLSRRGNSVSASDRLTAFLRMGEEGYWTKDDLKTWLSAAKCSQILPSGTSFKKFEEGPLQNVTTQEEIPYELLSILVGEVPIEASMAGDTAWYLEHLQAVRRKASEFPCAIYGKMGAGALKESPSVTVGTIHSVKGGEADVVILAPDLSPQGVESWHSSDEGKAAIYRLFYVGMTRAKSELYILNPMQASSAVRLL